MASRLRARSGRAAGRTLTWARVAGFGCGGGMEGEAGWGSGWEGTAAGADLYHTLELMLVF